MVFEHAYCCLANLVDLCLFVFGCCLVEEGVFGCVYDLHDCPYCVVRFLLELMYVCCEYLFCLVVCHFVVVCVVLGLLLGFDLCFVGAVCFCVCELSRCVFSDCLSVVMGCDRFLRIELVTVVVCMVFMLVYS